jgi:hypothetical protein
MNQHHAASGDVLTASAIRSRDTVKDSHATSIGLNTSDIANKLSMNYKTVFFTQTECND